VECKEIVAKNDLNVIPSAALCSSLTLASTVDTNTGGNVTGTYNMCGYSKSPTLAASNAGLVTAVAAGAVAGSVTSGLGAAAVYAWYTQDVATAAIIGTCASLTFDCAGVTDCTMYDGGNVVTELTDQNLDDLNSPSLGSPNIQEICAANPCKVPGGCELYGGDTLIAGATNCLKVGTAVEQADAAVITTEEATAMDIYLDAQTAADAACGSYGEDSDECGTATETEHAACVAAYSDEECS
jgi:hypothetical protein